MTSFTTFKRSAVVLVVTASCINCLCSLASQGKQEPGAASTSLEVRDESGRVRCRLGRIEKSGFGLQVFGEDASEQIILALDKDGFVFRSATGSKEGHLAVVANKEGSQVVLGDEGGNHVRVGLKSSGEFRIEHAASPGENTLLLRSDGSADGQSRFELRHPGKDKASSGFAVIADSKGVTLDLLRGGASTIQLASVSEGVSYLLLGARKLGIYLQSVVNGNSLLEFTNKTTRLGIQSTITGTGIAIDRKDGSSALRMGLDKDEEIVRNIWSGKGDQLKWDPK